MQDEAAECGDGEAAERHGHVPGDDLEGGGAHDVFHVEGAVEEEDAEGAVGEEERDDESGQAGHAEEGGGDEGLGRDPAFDVDSDEEEEGADNEEDVDVGRLPLVRRVRGIDDGKCEEDETADDEDGAEPIHLVLHGHSAFLFHV